MESKIKYLRNKAMNLPYNPGVYIMKDNKDEVIYVGKAKALKDRVSQYFGSDRNHTDKVRSMVKNVKDFEYIMTDTEFEALILECNLIKQYSPKYNILLKDDKGYSYIKITNEKWPKIIGTKQMLDDNATYIGPYMSSSSVNQAVDEALKIFKLPRCKKDFSKVRHNERPCLNYYIKQCNAPCMGKVSNKEYVENINEAIDFLKGGNSATINKLTKNMNIASENLEFEKAAFIRDKINAIKKVSEKQKIICSEEKNQDVIALVQSKTMACFEIFRFSQGRLSDTENYIFSNVQSDDIMRSDFIVQYYLNGKEIPPIILIDGDVDAKDSIEKMLSRNSNRKVKIIIPKKGEQLKLVNMCRNNAAEQISQRINRTYKETAALDELYKLLSLKSTPAYIESYDISNLSGSNNVAGMVVFENGRPLKSAYRRFKINKVVGQDDYASMHEVISRRLDEYEKLKDKGENEGFARLPDLILLDGGKGHVKVVKDLMSARGYDIPVYGMVKDDKHRTRAISKDGGEVSINSNRLAFTLISTIQEEVHRFAIGYHKQLRKNSSLSTELTKIRGIGENRAKMLLVNFKSLDKIKNATEEELISVPTISRALAKNIIKYFEDNY